MAVSCQLSIYHCHKELRNLGMRANNHQCSSVHPISDLAIFPLLRFSFSSLKGNFEKKGNRLVRYSLFCTLQFKVK